MLTNVPDHELTLSPNKKSSKRIGGPAAPPYGERRSRYSPNEFKVSDGRTWRGCCAAGPWGAADVTRGDRSLHCRVRRRG
jgi:hypothetical protein